MDVDGMMDLAIKGVEDVFGREVTYTPVVGPAVSTLTDGSPLKGVWTAPKQNTSPSAPVYDSADPRMDFRAASLVSAGITAPGKGDLLSFTVAGELRIYRVIKVEPNDEGSIIFYLAGRP